MFEATYVNVAGDSIVLMSRDTLLEIQEEICNLGDETDYTGFPVVIMDTNQDKAVCIIFDGQIWERKA